MKICWDNLEKIKLGNKGDFRIGMTVYIEMDSCERCGDPYLTIKHEQSKFCGLSCAMRGRKFSKKSREKMSKGCVNKTGVNGNWKGGVKKKNLPLYDTYAPQIDYVHETRSTTKSGLKLLEVRCKNCNKWFVPKLTDVCGRIYSLTGKAKGEHNLYCSEECKNNCGVFNQQTWPKNHKPHKINKSIWYTDAELSIWRDAVLKRENHICEYCGKPATIAHHSKAKKLEPFFALDPDYGVACCEKCHYKYGHQGECNTANLARVKCK